MSSERPVDAHYLMNGNVMSSVASLPCRESPNLQNPSFLSLPTAIAAVGVILAAFLLFHIELIAAARIVPQFGGGPYIWALCLSTYQLLLFIGYSYSYWIRSHFSLRKQCEIHAAVLTVGLITAFWSTSPTWFWFSHLSATPGVILTLLSSVGLPFFGLSALGILYQSWLSAANFHSNVYKLYALSNFGSVVALCAYPTLLEPYIRLSTQTTIWYIGLAVCSTLCLAFSRVVIKIASHALPRSDDVATGDCKARILWYVFPACASMFLVATTNRLSEDVPSFPLLWIAPLMAYLLGWIVAFAEIKVLSRTLATAVLTFYVCVGALADAYDISTSYYFDVLKLSATLFGVSTFCHSELHRLRPCGRNLHIFYLISVASSALGSCAATFLFPYIFVSASEYVFVLFSILGICVYISMESRQLKQGLCVGLIFSGLTIPLFWWSTRSTLVTKEFFLAILKSSRFWMPVLLGYLLIAYMRARKVNTKWLELFGNCALFLLVSGVILIHTMTTGQDDSAFWKRRSIYGTLRILDDAESKVHKHHRILVHGTTIHGLQFLTSDLTNSATAYYGASSGIGVVLNKPLKDSLRIAVIGLGVGTLATYSRPQDNYIFFELNPDVVTAAKEQFSYLRRAKGHNSVVLGDARVTLSHQINNDANDLYDVIVIDAFSSDAIPTHLLTDEAAQVYFSHLAAGGVLAFNISNAMLDLRPVVQALAARCSASISIVEDAPIASTGNYPSSWALLARDEERLTTLGLHPLAVFTPKQLATYLWTDDHASVLTVLK